MTTGRKKLSLGNVTERESAAGDRTRAWKVSPSRQETLKERARDMRRHPTEAQRALWEHLKDKQCGFTFNREVVMGSAIVDFACKTRWLVVEIGGTGDDAEATLATLSDCKLTDVGVRVLRFSDANVLEDTDAAVKTIKEELQKPWEKPRPGAAPHLPGSSPESEADPQGQSGGEDVVEAQKLAGISPEGSVG